MTKPDKTIFVIRGLTSGSSAADADFAGLRGMLADKGYRVVPVPVYWDRQTVSSYVDRLRHFYISQKGEHNTLLGGSFGAYAAFAAAPGLRPDALVLCSLSPFFREDLSQYEGSYVVNRFGEARANDFANHSAAAIAAQIKAAGIATTMFYGEKEQSRYPKLVARVKDAGAALGIRPIKIPGAGHRMREPEYVAGLNQALPRA